MNSKFHQHDAANMPVMNPNAPFPRPCRQREPVTADRIRIRTLLPSEKLMEEVISSLLVLTVENWNSVLLPDIAVTSEELLRDIVYIAMAQGPEQTLVGVMRCRPSWRADPTFDSLQNETRPAP